jgi:glycosyltransferase involved in cell wall biosynthesis
MKKILISGFAYDSGKSGISRYINSICKILSKDHILDIYMIREDVDKFPVKNDNIHFSLKNNILANPILSMLYHSFWFPFVIFLKKPDFVILPAANRRILFWYPIFTVSIFHDLSQYKVEAKYDRLRMFYIKNIIPFFLKKIHCIMAVSESTRKDISMYYKIPQKDIIVNYNGLSINAHGKKNKNFDFKYILYVSRIEHPGKNHLNLIKAYEKMTEFHNEYKLVLAGDFKEKSDIVLDYYEQSPLKDNIIFTGYISDDELRDVYQNSFLYVFPSFYEGFGLSILEAFFYGKPVACSNQSALEEVSGDASVKFNPYDVDDIKKAMERILSNPSLYEDCVQKGTERVKKFSWNNHVHKIIDEYEKYKAR